MIFVLLRSSKSRAFYVVNVKRNFHGTSTASTPFMTVALSVILATRDWHRWMFSLMVVCQYCNKSSLASKMKNVDDKPVCHECLVCHVCQEPIDIDCHVIIEGNGAFCCDTCCQDRTCWRCHVKILGPYLAPFGVKFHPECLRCSDCDEEIQGLVYFSGSEAISCQRCSIPSSLSFKLVQLDVCSSYVTCLARDTPRLLSFSDFQHEHTATPTFPCAFVQDLRFGDRQLLVKPRPSEEFLDATEIVVDSHQRILEKLIECENMLLENYAISNEWFFTIHPTAGAQHDALHSMFLWQDDQTRHLCAVGKVQTARGVLLAALVDEIENMDAKVVQAEQKKTCE
eukprot:m.84461 g.84461  ORF g.84461 m.84461 type:complete len:341 (+) comp21192_c0_seq5:1064-2086(+)